MSNMRSLHRKTVLVFAGICFCIFALESPAFADPVYGTYVTIDLEADGSPHPNCSYGYGEAGGSGVSSATDSCTLAGVGSAWGTADMVSGIVSAYAQLEPGSVFSLSQTYITIKDQVLIQGIRGGPSTGTLTFGDAGASVGNGAMDLIISNTAGTILGYSCDSTNPVLSEYSYGGCSQTTGGPGGAIDLTDTVLVTVDEQLNLQLDLQCYLTGPSGYSQSCAVNDPLSVTLSPGLQLVSALPDFLSGSESSVPEPSSVFLLGTAFLLARFCLRRPRAR